MVGQRELRGLRSYKKRGPLLALGSGNAVGGASWQQVPVRIGLGVGALSITVASICVLVGLRDKAVDRP